MSDYIANEEGRAEGIGAPAGALEKAVEFDIDKTEDTSPKVPETPSKYDSEALNAHVAAGHEMIAVDGKRPVKTGWRRMPGTKKRSGNMSRRIRRICRWSTRSQRTLPISLKTGTSKTGC